MRKSKQVYTRREVLGGFVAGIAATVLASTDLNLPSQGEYGLLIDTTECKYCKRCIQACADRHGDNTPGTYYTHVDLTNPTGNRLAPLAVPFHCMHCVDAPCVKVCQGHALTQTSMGAVTIDQDRCVGCLSCINVCPFEQTLHYKSPPPKIYKCDMCFDRISTGQLPACVEACSQAQHNALQSGPFQDMLYEANKRAAAVNGIVFYPEQTHTLMVFRKDEFNQSLMQGLDGLTPKYSTEARTKAGGTQLLRLGWIPFVGGTVYYLANWRKDLKTGDSGEKEKGG